MEVSTISNKQQHQYMLLSRLQSDCEYFLGYGNRSERHLYYGNVVDHIQGMLDLWNQLTVKPIWLSMERIRKYDKDMKK